MYICPGHFQIFCDDNDEILFWLPLFTDYFVVYFPNFILQTKATKKVNFKFHLKRN